jgi:hypothetical protein
MDVFNDPMYFNILYSYLDREEKGALRLVNKELRDAVILNVKRSAGPGYL